MRFEAISSSLSGVFCVFLMKPCRSTIAPSCTQKNTRAMRLPDKLLLISQSPLRPFIDRQSGIPTGHPNSAVLISSPIFLRSSSERERRNSRTGTRPVVDSKNRAAIALDRSYSDVLYKVQIVNPLFIGIEGGDYSGDNIAAQNRLCIVSFNYGGSYYELGIEASL